MPIARGQYAWVNRKNYSTHQRLNKEYLVDNVNNNNKIWFEQSNIHDQNKLNPQYVTRFSDAEFTFSLKNIKISTNKTGWYVQPVFRIELHHKDALILEKIHSFFGVGNFRLQLNTGRNSVAIYSVESIKDLINVIIPHFDKYPLLTQKQADFLIFKKIVILLSNKEHLTMEGLRKIVSMRASLNKGLSSLLKDNFKNIIPIERPIIEVPIYFDPFWILGFVEGEGCFNIKLSKYKDKSIVTLRFILSQHCKDRLLIINLMNFLGCGKLEETSLITRLVVNKFEDIQQKIIPFFKNYQLLGIKNKDFIVWCKASEIINNKAHLTKEGFVIFNSIKLNMNVGRSEISDISSTPDDFD